MKNNFLGNKIIVLIAFLAFTLVLAGCKPGLSDKEVQEELSSSSDQELDSILAKGDVEEGKALSGQATAFQERVTLNKSGRDVPLKQVYEAAQKIKVSRLEQSNDGYSKLFKEWKTYQEAGGWPTDELSFQKESMKSNVIVRDAYALGPETAALRANIKDVNDLKLRLLVNKITANVDAKKYAWWVIHANWMNEVLFLKVMDKFAKPSNLEMVMEQLGLDAEGKTGAGGISGGPGSALPSFGGSAALPKSELTTFTECIAAKKKAASYGGMQPGGGAGQPGGAVATTTSEGGSVGTGGKGMPQGINKNANAGLSGMEACYAMKPRPDAGYAGTPGGSYDGSPILPMGGDRGVKQSKDLLTGNKGEHIKLDNAGGSNKGVKDLVSNGDGTATATVEFVDENGKKTNTEVTVSPDKGGVGQLTQTEAQKAAGGSTLQTNKNGFTENKKDSKGKPVGADATNTATEKAKQKAKEEAEAKAKAAKAKPKTAGTENPLADSEYQANGCNDAGSIVGCLGIGSDAEQPPSACDKLVNQAKKGGLVNPTPAVGPMGASDSMCRKWAAFALMMQKEQIWTDPSPLQSSQQN